MILVMYNDYQDALRLYSTDHRQWIDMMAWSYSVTPLNFIIEWGWELIGEF